MQLAKLIEHTNIKPTATYEEIRNLCEEAIENQLFAVAVLPTWAELAVEIVKGTGVQVAIGISVPSGADTTEAKVFSAREVILLGADAVDMVMNIGAFKSGEIETVRNDISSVVRAVKEINPVAEVKVIIECCYLEREEKILAAKLVDDCGADFVKTSTGLGPSGATVEDVQLLRATVSPKVKVKAAGGIKTYEQAVAMIEAGAQRIGTSSGVEIATK